MTTTNTAAGLDSLRDMIGNATGGVQMIGGAIVVLVIAVVAIMVMTGALSQGGSLRQHLMKIAVVCVGALLLGGGAALGPMVVDVGKDLPKGSVSNNNGGVN